MKIESLTHHGLGRAEDGTLIPRVLPGEEIEGEKIVTPSSDRVAPPCRHFRTCGGCSMQHASDAFVAAWKIGIVETALKARGIDGEIAGIETSPPRSRRRAKLSGRRTKKGALVGFHARGSDVLIEVPDCEILLPALRGLIPALEELTVAIGSRKGEIAYTVTDTLNGPDLHIHNAKPLDEELRRTLADFAQANDLSRLVLEDEQIVTRLPPVQQFGKAQVAPPPGAFLQATRQGETALKTRVLDTVLGAARVVDLFSGCGTFSLPLAERSEVHAVETFAPMLEALDKGWRHTQGIKKVTTEKRDLFRNPLDVSDLGRFDAAVLDPPRAGAEAQVREIADSDLTQVAMVSCNPVTFARDAQTLLDGGFKMGPITVVDQFRWSAHVELFAAFTRL
ncbi:class I SAM-dependent RNA methyltransferase [Pelagovum pacificum]|uniref:Class I SAM-dependent RNA methyltransferase n=1 Tax=Pelagovum pacificum TaxID=2588711 RepID=A0A5C5GHD6_9RHOB|nr:class I SAM-dependent RNA methyltransferase [Pelagovum pacificum]QQA42841.1 class I SAM-dependent RNA methyltransferase [Pelagovum pacificum]TNY34010.1 class I SAM-dependent RNA methyltransferase [Pelagovum pacificum]